MSCCAECKWKRVRRGTMRISGNAPETEELRVGLITWPRSCIVLLSPGFDDHPRAHLLLVLGQRGKLGKVCPTKRLEHRHDAAAAVLLSAIQHGPAPYPAAQEGHGANQRSQSQATEDLHGDVRRILEKPGDQHRRIANAEAGEDREQAHQPQRAPGALFVALRPFYPFLQMRPLVQVAVSDKRFQKGRLLLSFAHSSCVFALTLARSIPRRRPSRISRPPPPRKRHSATFSEGSKGSWGGGEDVSGKTQRYEADDSASKRDMPIASFLQKCSLNPTVCCRPA